MGTPSPWGDWRARSCVYGAKNFCGEKWWDNAAKMKREGCFRGDRGGCMSPVPFSTPSVILAAFSYSTSTSSP